MRVWTFGVAVFLCIASPVAGQPEGGPVTTFRSGVGAVTLEVGVTGDDGAPVTDLDAGDFTVSVAGKTRRVVSATYVDATAPGLPSLEATRLPISTNDGLRGGRLLVFVIDQGTLTQSEARQAAAAASRLLGQLTYADRSAAVLLPVGAGVPFTSDHPRVLRALMQAGGFGSAGVDPSGLGLEEVRAIAAGDFLALQAASTRQCPNQPDPSAAGAAAGQQPGGSPGQAGGGASSPGGLVPSGFGSLDSCSRRIQFEAQSVWQQVHATALSSITALRAVFADLRKISGEKTVILVSGGWALQLKESASDVQPVAEAAEAAGATVYTLFAASPESSAERRTIARSPLADEAVRRWPLQALSGMTGGASYRVDAGAGPVFERLAREISGFYRIGVEQDPADVDRRPRAVKIQVSRPGTRVRARERFVLSPYAQRDAAGRLDEALTAPLPATGLGVRLASYLGPDPDAAARVKVVLVGDAFGLQPGAASFQLMLQDPSGAVVGSSSQPLGDATGDRLPFVTSISVAPSRYVVRLAVVDAAGRVGSVDHVLEARHAELGALSRSDLILSRVPAHGGEAKYLLDGVQHDEKLALQLELAGDPAHVAAADVRFEVAATAEGPALVRTEATMLTGRGTGLAQALADVRMLPPGYYVARARVRSEGVAEGVVMRPFLVVGTARADAGTVGTRETLSASSTPAARFIPRPSFSVGQVLATPVLGGFLDRLAARSDAAGPGASAVIAGLRDTPPTDVDLPAGLDVESPVVAHFAEGLSRLARKELDPAARSFRAALTASEDFYPAMVYLGACFAAAGKDREAAGAWQTALIKTGDVPAVHLLLADALLRLGRAEDAFEATSRARGRWPEDPVVARRYVLAAFAAGRNADALDALDTLPGEPADEEALLLGIQALYEGLTRDPLPPTADADRARLVRYAGQYRKIEGPSLALVETWVSAVAAR